MFSGLFRMPEKCPSCHLKFEREPGYFLGLAAFCIGWPTFFFRYARALWLALDLRFDEKLFHARERPPTVPKETP